MAKFPWGLLENYVCFLAHIHRQKYQTPRTIYLAFARTLMIDDDIGLSRLIFEAMYDVQHFLKCILCSLPYVIDGKLRDFLHHSCSGNLIWSTNGFYFLSICKSLLELWLGLIWLIWQLPDIWFSSEVYSHGLGSSPFSMESLVSDTEFLEILNKYLLRPFYPWTRRSLMPYLRDQPMPGNQFCSCCFQSTG